MPPDIDAFIALTATVAAAVASRFMAVPVMVWSARNVIEATARRSAGEDDRQDHDRCADGDRQEFHDKCAAECADDHDALQADVDDAGVFREAAAQRHQQERPEHTAAVAEKYRQKLPCAHHVSSTR